MVISEILLISIGLAMDAFAVSICKGVAIKNLTLKKIMVVGIYFGTFQAIMPTIGYLFGTSFQEFVTKIDHWIAFGLLVFIGANMLKDAFSKNEEGIDDNINFKTMIILAIATSIDALAVGITFAFLNVNVIFANITIGIVAFLISIIGVKIGNKFGNKYENKAECIGGIILILIGVKILLEHLVLI